MTIKPVAFRGDSLEALRAFPDDARHDAGFQLDKVQRGEEPDDWKPMASIGAGVKEIRIWDAAGIFRVVYLAKLADGGYVLHCFQKKTQETSEKDIKLARKRYKDLMKEKQP
ncbi:MAG: type II toxin-antitoxin system RelE/ParE family toxin [Sterolibacteriaceae bacterium MAG5]|nr:type II toxin-antitoxin system RelE/ParE family toxin [Candidatus Nitricoxidireducens bremensis]